eukprot:CAMPEP_0183505984 /NCGR_PEP_ID=MMETSP0371-20130417/7085_1 /TAXON_ID=268820 /ORGANISM="Peridinium aciculiferum, Strain PAER-2" /LENGTH=332 /DNA_ID=CAMNT_0025701819 /DNA_START=63 /DNA_END=1063 /DNA_ORIENTATION=+
MTNINACNVGFDGAAALRLPIREAVSVDEGLLPAGRVGRSFIRDSYPLAHHKLPVPLAEEALVDQADDLARIPSSQCDLCLQEPSRCDLGYMVSRLVAARRLVHEHGVKLAVVLGACKAADMATERFGDKEVRTTNAMPYPPSTPLRVESFAKHFYAKSQFAATSLAVFGCPVLAFGSVLAIEAASILMTLVRKGLIEAHTYHVVYGLSLFAMFPAIVVSIHFLDASAQIGALRALAATAFAVTLRMPDLQLPLVKRLCGSSKYMAWALAILLAPIMDALQLVFSDQLVLLIAYLGMLSSAGDTVMKLLHPAVVPKATKDTDATAPERAIGG